MGHGDVGLSGEVSRIVPSIETISASRLSKKGIYIDKSVPQIAQISLKVTSWRQGSMTERTG